MGIKRLEAAVALRATLRALEPILQAGLTREDYLVVYGEICVIETLLAELERLEDALAVS